jgi:glycosyltransferase involved in cell wall biosynthesis
MNKPIYIVVTPFFPSITNWRGAYCHDFVVALKKTGVYDVRVFVPGTGDDYAINGIRVYRFPIKQLPSNIFPFLFASKNQKSFLNAVKKAGISIEDVAVCHGHTANYAVYPMAIKKYNSKCVTLLHHHDLQSYGLNMGVLRHFIPYTIIQFLILRKWHEKIDCHVFISGASRMSFLVAPDTEWTIYDDYKAQMRGPRLFGCRSVRIRESIVLHNGVELEIFKPRNVQNMQKEFVIGCIGNFTDLKGQFTLLKAVKILDENRDKFNDIKVILIGSGPDRSMCEFFAKENRIDAEFRSEVRHEELPEFYHSLDLFVLPSYFEGFGCVFTEAWACGVPFITCEGQGMDDVIPNEERSKWLCKPRDPEDLANKIGNYMEHRWEQKLAGPIEINELVSEFVRKIQGIVVNCDVVEADKGKDKRDEKDKRDLA